MYLSSSAPSSIQRHAVHEAKGAGSVRGLGRERRGRASRAGCHHVHGNSGANRRPGPCRKPLLLRPNAVWRGTIQSCEQRLACTVMHEGKWIVASKEGTMANGLMTSASQIS
jgi:hypothetical protein